MRSRLLLVLGLLMPIVALPGCGGSSSTPPPPHVVTISVSSSQSSVPVGGTALFVATVHGSSNHAVTWQVNGVTGGDATSGTISTSGSYVAPLTIPSPATVIINGIAQADTTKSAATSIIVAPSLSPTVTTVLLQDGQQFTAAGTSGGVNWTVSCVSPCDSSRVGTISSTGFYTAPDSIPDNLLTDASLSGIVDASPVTVMATLQSDPASSASATVYLNAGGPSVNQAGQSAPVVLGTTGGNVKDFTSQFCCSGTLGSLVVRNLSNFVLSNAHVLSRSGNASNGEAIGQPGLVDDKCKAGTTVANLSQTVPLNHGGTSAADAAIAQVAMVGLVAGVDSTGKILQLGSLSAGLAGADAPASGTPEVPVPGLFVAKSGRTTGLACSTISSVNGTFTVEYENSCGSNSTFLVTYTNQVDIVSNTFSAPGDSGSLIVDAETAQPVALLYAGSGTDTIANPAQTVLANLGDGLNPQHFPTFVGGSQHKVEGCTGVGPSAQRLTQARPTDEQMIRASAVKEKHVTDLMRQPGVIGVAVGAGDAAGEAAVIVYLDKDKKHGAMPASLDGVKVKVRSVKHFKAYERLVCPPAKAAPQLVELRDHVLKPCH